MGDAQPAQRAARSHVNDWIMLTNTPTVFVSSPLSGLLRDQLQTLGTDNWPAANTRLLQGIPTRGYPGKQNKMAV